MAHDLPATAGKAVAPAASFRKCRRARSIADLPYRSKDVENAGHKTRPRQYPMLLYWNNAIWHRYSPILLFDLPIQTNHSLGLRVNLIEPQSEGIVRLHRLIQ